MKTKFILFSVLLLCVAIAKSQNNEFKIGILFSNIRMHETPVVNGPYLSTGQLSFGTATVNISGQSYKTSPLNVISEDGFNSIYFFEPNVYQMSENQYRRTLDLVKANNMTILAHSQLWYVPNSPVDGGGRNVYDNNLSIPYDPNSGCDNYQDLSEKVQKARPNYWNLSAIYNDPLYKDVIWGHDIANEMNFAHPKNYGCDPLNSSQYTETVEIPPSNVSEAISYFKNNLIPSSQKTVVAVVNHDKTIHENTNDSEYNISQGNYQNDYDHDPQQYLNIQNKPDILIDASYYQYPISNWWTTHQNSNILKYPYSNILNSGQTESNGSILPENNDLHYLGKFASLDYFRRKGYNNIQTWITCERYWPHNGTDLIAAYNTTNVYNANWIWFQTYTSIIHGCQGILLYVDNDYDASLGEQNNKDYMFDNYSYLPAGRLDRYNRQYFSSNYKKFISNLGRELRYLKNRGFLSTDPNSILYTKTNQSDPNCFVPSATSYIPENYPAGYGPAEGGTLSSDLRSENYGLRYTIRTNGESAIMIISNPLNIPITTTLNFDNATSPFIKNSTGVRVLFESNGKGWSPNSSTYKTEGYRNSNINLNNNTLGQYYNIWYNSGPKNVQLTFGPSDVHVIEFVTANVANYKNGWEKVWSNENLSFVGSYKNGWGILDNNEFIPGDFDGDGNQELLCIQQMSQNAYSGIYKFNGGNWEWVWDNGGNGWLNSQTHGYHINQNSKYYVGKFTNSSRDELLIDINGYMIICQFNHGNWQWIWSNDGQNINLVNYRNKLTVGDFDGDGKSEIIGVYNNDISYFEFLPNHPPSSSWSKISINNNSTSHHMWPYRNNLVAGDFDGNDGQDDLLGFSSWATIFYRQSNGGWSWGETSGGYDMAGWQLPLKWNDVCMAGNIDGDDESEILLIETGPSAFHSNSMTARPGTFNSHWTENDFPYINDWSINDYDNFSSYFLIKPFAHEPNYLVAYKKTACNNNYLLSMYKSINGTNKSIDGTNKLEASSINERIDNTISVYPNPTLGSLVIESNNDIILHRIEVIDMTGRILKSIMVNKGNSKKINISDLESNILLVKTYTNQGVYVNKIIKN